MNGRHWCLSLAKKYMEEWNFENWGIKYWSKTPGFLQYVKEHS